MSTSPQTPSDSRNHRRFVERLMGMDDATWNRHANPWSGWSRMTVLPLLACALWARSWIGWWVFLPIVGLVLWTWINPRLFPAPQTSDNWMTQSVLGERIWLARHTHTIPDHHARAARILIGVSVIGVVALGYGLWHLDLGITLVGLVLSVGGKLWFLDRMVWLYQDFGGGSARPSAPLK